MLVDINLSLLLNRILQKTFIVFFVLSNLSMLYSVDVEIGTRRCKDSNRVYLASFPRSGNRWFRSLVEEATGIYTYSVYIPYKKLYIDEQYGYFGRFGTKNKRHANYEEQKLIKTHYPLLQRSNFDLMCAKKSFRIIRNPIDSFYSYYKYQNKVSDIKPIVPHESVVKYIDLWKKFHDYWNSRENVINIKYEDFLKDPFSNLANIIKELGLYCDVESIKSAFKKYPPINFECCHIEHFKREDLELILLELKEYLLEFGYDVSGVSIKIEQKSLEK